MRAELMKSCFSMFMNQNLYPYRPVSAGALSVVVPYFPRKLSKPAFVLSTLSS